MYTTRNRRRFLRRQLREFSIRALLSRSTLLFLCIQLELAQDREYGRSMVVTDRGIVATSQVLASQAGAQILRRGGSAMGSYRDQRSTRRDRAHDEWQRCGQPGKEIACLKLRDATFCAV